MTEIAAPLSVQPLPRAVAPASTSPAAQVQGDAALPARGSRLRRLASALADTHRAAVPF